MPANTTKFSSFVSSIGKVPSRKLKSTQNDPHCITLLCINKIFVVLLEEWPFANCASVIPPPWNVGVGSPCASTARSHKLRSLGKSLKNCCPTCV